MQPGSTAAMADIACTMTRVTRFALNRGIEARRKSHTERFNIYHVSAFPFSDRPDMSRVKMDKTELARLISAEEAEYDVSHVLCMPYHDPPCR